MKFQFDIFMVSVFATLFGMICAILLMIGIGAMAEGSSAVVANPNNPLTQIPQALRVAAGGSLAFFGLAGVVFSGGVHMLIAIYEKLREFEERGAQRTAAPRAAPALSPQVAVAAVAPARAVLCPRCSASNAPDSRFCESCGNSLAAS